jgi:hypothetical protein
LTQYEGDWNNNLPDGWGCIFDQIMTNRYYGDFKGGLRHGLGTFYYADSSMYKGEWVNGQKEGFAEHTLEDGSCIMGVFEKDRMILQLQVRHNERDNLLCNQITQYQDAPEVGTAATLGDTTFMGRSMINPNLAQDVSNQVSESRAETANKIQTSMQTISLTPATGVVNLTVSNHNISQGDANEPPSRVTAMVRRNNARVQGNKTPTQPVPPLQPNLYLGMLNFDDILSKHTLDERFTIAPIIIESLLRIHSGLKDIYTSFSADHFNSSRLGTIITRTDWWQFCRQFRICTSRATLIQADRLIDLGKKNNYDAWNTKGKVKISVDGVRELAKLMTPIAELQESGRVVVTRSLAESADS